MIKFNDFTFQYPQSEKPLFSQINLNIPANSLTLVSGPSGVGKSTFLRCINGLVPHFSGGTISGDLSVFGLNPILLGPEIMAEHTGFVFQEPEAQFVYDSIEDEIAFALENHAIPYQDMHHRVNKIIHAFGLDRFRQEKIQNLSGGEKQKISLASVMITHPKVLLLDEPTSQLDPVAADDLLKFLLKLMSEHGLTVLISEHRLERLLPYIDNILHIDKTNQFHFGKPQSILKKMSLVPPIIKIGRALNLDPLPLCVEGFPPIPQIKNSLIEDSLKKKSANKPTLIELKNFSVKLSGHQILTNVSLDIRPREILTLLGPNGAGKTTLLRGIMGLVESEGEKILYEEDMKSLKLNTLVQTIAYLPQNPNDLLFSESIIEELKTTLNNHGVRKSETELINFLENFDLASLKDRFPRDLSVGERQRTALAAITVHGPQIIFLDEPTRGMDYLAKKTLTSLLRRWRDQNKAIILVTHDIEFAAELSDRTIILEAGRIRFVGDPRNAFTIFPKYQTQTARIFSGTGWITPKDIHL
jgi:energy-coupling factor transport system ATP-binding protein